MQFGDAKSDFRLHAFKSLGLHRNGSGQWRTHDHPWPKLNRQFRCSDCLVGLITDISTATKISAKPTSELHMIVSPQNSAENVTANRLSEPMPNASWLAPSVVASVLYLFLGATMMNNTPATPNCTKVTAIGSKRLV